MKFTLHLAPPSLAKRSAPKEGQKRAPLTERDFDGFSGRVVTLKVLDFVEAEAANMEALNQVTDGMNGAHVHHFKQVARIKAALIGVSDMFVEPATAVPDAAKPITDEEKAGAGKSPRKFDALFTPKDLLVLKEWDGRHHAVSSTDAEAILGKAILSEG